MPVVFHSSVILYGTGTVPYIGTVGTRYGTVPYLQSTYGTVPYVRTGTYAPVFSSHSGPSLFSNKIFVIKRSVSRDLRWVLLQIYLGTYTVYNLKPL